MTNKQQTELWYQYNTFRLRKAAAYRPAIYKAIQQQIQFFADTRNIDNIPLQPVADVIKNLYVNVGRLWAMKSYKNVQSQATSKSFQTKAVAFGFNEDFINAILQYFEIKLLNDAVLPITRTTKEWILKVLSKGIQQGLGIDAIVVDMLKSDITKVRAELIARTEVMKASNYGADLGAEKTGLLLDDVWISIRDHRTRKDHITADGQVVRHGQPFIIGIEKYQMLRPGDSESVDGRKVPAKEICNCRCVKGHRPVRGANGLPLRV